jgi:hypothetical protein
VTWSRIVLLDIQVTAIRLLLMTGTSTKPSLIGRENIGRFGSAQRPIFRKLKAAKG